MREIINKQLKEYRDKDIALLFSGGLDSLSILLCDVPSIKRGSNLFFAALYSSFP